MIDTLKGDIGLNNIHLIYSGRGYHIRILDEEIMDSNSDLRSEILKYVAGAEVPKLEYSNTLESGARYAFEHFSIPIGYPKVFTDRCKFNIQHLTGTEEIEGINQKLLKDIIKNRELLEDNQWGIFKSKIGPRRYKNMVNAISRVNIATIDAKVTIDLKRILRLPTSLHSKVSMKCVEVKDREWFNPLDDAVPKFVGERKEKK